LGLFFQISHELTRKNSNNLHKIGFFLHFFVQIFHFSLIYPVRCRLCLSHGVNAEEKKK
jgi:hypothetical protein